ncbi:TPA: ankyrin repeat domain-containing protein, partial [Serratia marcescens]
MNRQENLFVMAVQLKDHEPIAEFIKKGVDVNCRNGVALTTAANQGDYMTVQMLLKAGAEVNFDKTKALKLAAQNGHTDIVELLMDYGAENIDAAIKAATKKKQKEALWLLFTKNNDEQSKFKRLAKNKRAIETIKEILNWDCLTGGTYMDALAFLILEDDIHTIE